MYLDANWIFCGEPRSSLAPLADGSTGFHHDGVFHDGGFGGLPLPLMRRSLETDARRGFETITRQPSPTPSPAVSLACSAGTIPGPG